MAALQQDRHAILLLQFLSGFAHRFQIANWLADQCSSFFEVWDEQRRQWKQFRFVKGNCIRTQKEIATGCDHHRIDDEWNAIVDFTNRVDNCARDHFDDSDRVEQPCLGGSNWEMSDVSGALPRSRPTSYAPSLPIASTGQPSIASLQSASSSGVSGCL